MIEIRRVIPADEESRLMDAVHTALRESFKIPPSDRNVRLIAHEAHRFACPPGRTHPELYTMVTIDVFVGRSLKAKRALYLRVVENLEALGIPRDHVTILLRESAKENWGVRGGQAASDVDLGFKVEV